MNRLLLLAAASLVYAPLELEWNAYLSISRQVRASREMQAVFQSFAERAEAVMQSVWARWHGS